MYFTESSLKATAQRVRTARNLTSKGIIEAAQRRAEQRTTFDIFMSHAYLDRETIAGLVAELEEMGHTVYVDWLYDGDLSRKRVTAETAQRLRERMVTSKSLFYATTKASTESKWMPWECGFFDGFKGKVATLPVLQSTTSTFKGQEYLSLYPVAQKDRDGYSTNYKLWIHESATKRKTFEQWLGQQTLVERHR